VMFWSGRRKRPIPISFDPNNPLHNAFIHGLVQMIALSIPPDSSPQKQTFDKDFAEHVNFVFHCSVLYAISYNIPLPDRQLVYNVAGKMIPAIITTSALVTAFMSLNLFQILRKTSGTLSRQKLISMDYIGSYLTEIGISQPSLYHRKLPWVIDLGVLDKGETIGSILDRLWNMVGENAGLDLLVYQVGEALYPLFTPEDVRKINSSLWDELNEISTLNAANYIRLFCGKYKKPVDGPVRYTLEAYSVVKLLPQ